MAVAAPATQPADPELLTPAAPASTQPTTKAVTVPADQAASLVTIERGDLPIIVSAPHGGTIFLEGVPVRTGRNGAVVKFETVLDGYTQPLAAEIANAIERETGKRPYVVIARFSRKMADANRPAEGAYEDARAKVLYDTYHGALDRAAAEIRERFGRGWLIDVHAQGNRRDAIFRGTNQGASVRDLIARAGTAGLIGPDSLVGQLRAAGVTFLPESPDPAAIGKEVYFSGGYIVQAHGSGNGTKIDAMQMEFGIDYRRPAVIPETAAKVAKALVHAVNAFGPGVPAAPGPASHPSGR
jgi:hypothetical protein